MIIQCNNNNNNNNNDNNNNNKINNNNNLKVNFYEIYKYKNYKI